MRKKTPSEPRESVLASGWTVEAEPAAATAAEPAAPAGGDAEAAAPAEADEIPEQMSNGALVVLGVFGGVYLLYTWGWLVIAQAYADYARAAAAGSGSLGVVLQQIVYWAAPAAPVLWFLAALLASRGGRTGRLALLLLVGLVVLLPLPLLFERGA